jgi:hypothetical protein
MVREKRKQREPKITKGLAFFCAFALFAANTFNIRVYLRSSVDLTNQNRGLYCSLFCIET